jgi:hypothetical protein
MSYVNLTSGGKQQLDKTETFCSLMEHSLPESIKLFTELLDEFDSKVKSVHPTLHQGALNNAHGDWYEWLLAIAAWNYHASNPNSHLALLLPNIKRFDVIKLYINELSNLVIDLREKVADSASVQLITSNPDFVVISPENLEIPEVFNRKIDKITAETISLFSHSYEHFVDKCSFENIIGYLSVKSSLRPDRRLQIPHEGSLMKAVYTHLQTRKWEISPKGLKYYAMSTKVTEADRNALKTVATHSITTVHNVPQAAVDEVFEVNSSRQAEDVYRQILH